MTVSEQLHNPPFAKCAKDGAPEVFGAEGKGLKARWVRDSPIQHIAGSLSY